MIFNKKRSSDMLKVLRNILLVCLFSPAMVMADDYVAGQHYQVLASPVPTLNANKIEVVELFWYGCPHCFSFEPLLDEWQATLGDDVEFWHSPAMWNERMNTHARIYYAAEVLGVLDKAHPAVFKAMNVDRKKLLEEDDIAALFVTLGVSKEDFSKAFNSFGVKSSVRQADARARGYKITGTPEMVVNGKYRISASTAGGQVKMLDVANYLIKKEREAKK